MTTRQHLSSHLRKVTTCFVLDDCDVDCETFANIVDGDLSFSMEPAKQTSSTPIAFNAVDTREGNILDIHTAYDDDGPRSGGDEHESDRNTFKNGTYCGMLSGDALRDYPKQVVSLTKAGNASTDLCEFLPWTKNIMALTQRFLFLSGKQTTRAQVGKNGPWQGSKKVPRQNEAQDLWHGSKTALFSDDRRNYKDTVPHDRHITHSATIPASTNPDRRLTDLVLKDTKITERQFDPAKERMLEQLLLLSGVNNERSIMYQFSLHCVEGTTELDITFEPTHERPEHPEENKIPSLRVVDLVANDSVRSIIDDKCNTCCHGEARRQETVVNLGPFSYQVAYERDYFQRRRNNHSG